MTAWMGGDELKLVPHQSNAFRTVLNPSQPCCWDPIQDSCVAEVLGARHSHSVWLYLLYPANLLSLNPQKSHP